MRILQGTAPTNLNPSPKSSPLATGEAHKGGTKMVSLQSRCLSSRIELMRNRYRCANRDGSKEIFSHEFRHPNATVRRRIAG